ncbi:TWiK family of potassium channels protein 18 [Eumeta japonica]|uniref:TWiK family of potassium channels protein 18 n=1 Tax=Eumeta variegata TaxID=151549 RepID=A0A4C1TXP6_EUMVA|nr:TWiK family of potassium channels protein 18 [Eumeta japonica]
MGFSNAYRSLLPRGGPVSCDGMFGFGGGFFVCSMDCYGHLSPRTSWGKLTTILYALLGMPLFLLYLSNVGKEQSQFSNYGIKKFIDTGVNEKFSLLHFDQLAPSSDKYLILTQKADNASVTPLESQVSMGDCDHLFPDGSYAWELFASWFKWLYALVCLCRGCPGFHRRRVAKLRAQPEELGLSPSALAQCESGTMSRTDGLVCCPNHAAGVLIWLELKAHSSIRRQRSAPVSDTLNIAELWFTGFRNVMIIAKPISGSNWKSFRDRPADLQITEELGELSELESIEALGREASRNVLESFSGHGPSAFQNHSRSRKLNYLRTLSEPQSRQYVHHERAYTERRSDRRPYGENDLRCGDDYVTHNRRLNRGQSLPAGYGCDEGSSTTATSDFTYVTFDAQTITVPISVCVSILVGYVIFGSMIFGMWEKWDQLDGAYFCFISLSSIGFGDFVPGERVYTPTIETSFIVCSLYLMLGMALVAMCFNLMQVTSFNIHAVIT